MGGAPSFPSGSVNNLKHVESRLGSKSKARRFFKRLRKMMSKPGFGTG